MNEVIILFFARQVKIIQSYAMLKVKIIYLHAFESKFYVKKKNKKQNLRICVKQNGNSKTEIPVIRMVSTNRIQDNNNFVIKQIVSRPLTKKRSNAPNSNLRKLNSTTISRITKIVHIFPIAPTHATHHTSQIVKQRMPETGAFIFHPNKI